MILHQRLRRTGQTGMKRAVTEQSHKNPGRREEYVGGRRAVNIIKLYREVKKENGTKAVGFGINRTLVDLEGEVSVEWWIWKPDCKGQSKR